MISRDEYQPLITFGTAIDMLAEIFRVMVVPAIDEVRRLDREHISSV